MFIRRVKTRTTEDGSCYYSHRLVENYRVADREPMGSDSLDIYLKTTIEAPGSSPKLRGGGGGG
ncbi:MAG: hypothetical protein M3H12_00570 [Chromatiales bacterium]